MNRIIYVPGKNPKPPAAEHEALLFRCLVHGVSRMRRETAEAIAASGCFSLVAWNRLFYHEERAIGDFTPWVEQMLSREAPPDEREVRRHQRKYRLSRFLYQAGDSLPFLIPLIPDRRIKASIADTERYFANHGNIACKVRDVLKKRLRESAKAGDRVLLIAHSMGSIIAWDSLYELHRLEGVDHCGADRGRFTPRRDDRRKGAGAGRNVGGVEEVHARSLGAVRRRGQPPRHQVRKRRATARAGGDWRDRHRAR